MKLIDIIIIFVSSIRRDYITEKSVLSFLLINLKKETYLDTQSDIITERGKKWGKKKYLEQMEKYFASFVTNEKLTRFN